MGWPNDASDPNRAMPRRVLIVVAAELAEGEVRDAVLERARNASEVRVIAPALTRTVVEQAMGDVDDAIAAAQERLDRALKRIGSPGAVTTGEVGDSDMRLAIQDALQTFSADEIVIVAHEEDALAREHKSIAEAEKSFEPPITELYVTEPDGERARVAETERVGPGISRVDPGEVDTRSRNLPPVSVRDMAGIGIAVVGTAILFILAATCDTAGFAEGFDSCAARLLLAGAFFLINLAHVIGLTLFQAGPYRGSARRFFAISSIVGTPIAVVVSAVVLG
jgi:hypothetical protein